MISWFARNSVAANLLMWAIIIAVSVYPVFRWLSGKLGNRPTLAAIVVALLMLLLIVNPKPVVVEFEIFNTSFISPGIRLYSVVKSKLRLQLMG